MNISKFPSLRLENELKSIKADRSSFLPELKPNILFVIPDSISGMTNIFKWTALIQGRSKETSSPYAEGLYPININFDDSFPRTPPKISFEPGFKHIHIYDDGQICLPLVNERNWSAKYDMINVLNQVEELIHAEPRISSPANSKLSEIYRNDKEKYKNIIEEQARETWHKFKHLIGKI